MAVTFNFLNNGPNGPTVFYDYPMATAVSSSSPATIPYAIQIYNPLSIPLYAQVSGSVTLASGSTAVLNVSTQNLGELPANTNTSSTATKFMVSNLTCSAYPSTTGMNEVETVNITVSLYTDSGYSNLYESGSSSFRLDFINSANTGFTKVIDYDGNTTPSLGFSSGVSAATYVTSPVLVSNGYAIEVSSTTVPSGDWIDFTNGGGIIQVNGSNVYSIAEFYVYPTATTSSIPGDQPFQLQNQVYIYSLSYPYFYVATANTWQIIYLIMESNETYNGNYATNYAGGINNGGYQGLPAGNYPSFTMSETGTYYIGYVVVLESTTNFL